MNLLKLIAALGLSLGIAVPALSAVSMGTTDTTIAAQDDCKEGEKWNEEKQKCEAS